MQARSTLHGLGEENVTALLLDAFRSFDTDGSGRLERDEIVACLESLTLGSTKLTPREIRFVTACIDEDDSGTIEYNEFAPLMFNYLVEALKMGFLQSEMDDLGKYLRAHLYSYDEAGDGVLPRHALKAALADADRLRLTPIQVHTCLADAPEDAEGRVEIEAFVGPASRLILKMVDPALAWRSADCVLMSSHLPH